ncbi:MAG: hypothetical protein OWP43_06715 [Sphaerochaetaceae bacterium]|nr:hypothetical protein [Sphaerochaetaceae bacterium]
MRKFVERLVDLRVGALQLLLLLLVFFLPFRLNISSFITSLFTKDELSFENMRFYFINLGGNLGIGIFLFFLVLKTIRKKNKDQILNKGDIYHKHSYFWFYICSKLLGFTNCNLVLVPIYMQFKLVIRDTFDKYPLDEIFFPESPNNDINVTIKNQNYDLDKKDLNEINLVLEDTYEIDLNQIPKDKQALKTIKISRNNKNHLRQYSDLYVNKIITKVRELPNGTILNIFATTNPKHTYQIVKRAFSLGNRGNISKIFVYQQEKDNERLFIKSKKI